MVKEKLDPTNSLFLSAYIGSLIRDERGQQRLTGQNLAKLMNISQQQISRYECGKSHLSIELLFRFFQALKMEREQIECFFHKILNELYRGDETVLFLQKERVLMREIRQIQL
ncbi:helix-turn-helix domain-containing protein [Morganella morganii]|uniref:helix-turn-helix domain-containing protein n=1 Tax=Morganella morganii TaxID=582 RepID=UPI0021CDED79|nr:helix-turn-helix transcriptional regulator [Morganella morganii]MCU6274036.1 helix-turn-helix domain-containing protein [Morganella morganii]